MVGETAVADAVARARALPSLRVGLHIALIEAAPVSPPETIPDLVDGEGRFRGDMVAAGFRFFFLPRVRRQLEQEIHAQFAAFAATGLPLDHVNTHKHIHLHPTVAALIIRIGRDYGLRALRLPVEPPRPIAQASGVETRPGLGATALRLWTGQLARTIRRAGLVANDHVFGLAWSGALTEDRLLALIPNLPDGVSEIYGHPATTMTPGIRRTMPDYRHPEELAGLTSPRVRDALAAHGIIRTSFSELAV
jgi:hopanoid biosynthesis associated protein HpnK